MLHAVGVHTYQFNTYLAQAPGCLYLACVCACIPRKHRQSMRMIRSPAMTQEKWDFALLLSCCCSSAP